MLEIKFAMRLGGGVFQRYFEFICYQLFSPIRWLVERGMGFFDLYFLYRVYGTGLGDALMISAVVSELEKRGGAKVIVFSKNHELFYANPNVVLNIDYRKMSKLVRSLLKSLAKYMRGRRVICVGQEKWVIGSFPGRDFVVDWKEGTYLHNLLPDWHPKGFFQYSDCPCPRIYFSEEELVSFGKKFSLLNQPYAVVKATVGVNRHSSMELKEWGADKMQSVIEALPLGSLKWVQIGQKEEPDLNGVVNMKGLSIRETLFVMSRATFVLTTEGFVSHAAAALDIPCVVVFSGRHAPDKLVYKSTIPVVSLPMPACSPCFADICSNEVRVCTENISVAQVVEAICKQKLDAYGFSSLH